MTDPEITALREVSAELDELIQLLGQLVAILEGV